MNTKLDYDDEETSSNFWQIDGEESLRDESTSYGKEIDSYEAKLVSSSLSAEKRALVPPTHHAMGVSVIEGLVKSVAMTIVSEIGDKTFFVAALMAMRHPRRLVLIGAFGALAVRFLKK
ncbi:hypothetical protein L7F22_038333 [Adiantum nelumboides]|nr:hypothetical protein [Adiantum nelumboides]